jgi:predicted alpha/beta superfamily hydrolase
MATALVTQFTERNRESPSDAPNREEHELASALLGESRPYTVHLPDFYARDTDIRYPVWIVLDGDWRGPETAEVARTFDRAGLAPGHLVVAVSNVPRGRDQDFLPPGREANGATGGADRFLAFLDSELLPAVDSLYRTTDVRLLSGHSLGGMFAAYAVAERPDVFDAVFAFSPSFWVGDGADADRLIDLATSGGTEATVYLNMGDERGPMRTHFDRLAAALDAAETPNWTTEVVEGTSHDATYRFGTPAALRAFWRDLPDDSSGT